MFGRRGIRPGGRQPGLGLMLLGLQIAQVGVNRIPPVTLATIGAQVALYLGLLDFGYRSLSEVCISPVAVWYREDYTRLLTAAFFHADEWHLYYNMASFLWKGISLEKRLGGAYFVYMIGVFTLLCNVTTIGLAMLAEHILHDPSYLSQCAVGFSGVIFALKVVTTHMLPPGTTRIMGLFPVHSRIACWVELVVIQLLVPRASFLGHLAGILVGTAYCKGPLKNLMNFVVTRPPSYTYMAAPSGSYQGNYGYTTGASGYRSGYYNNDHTQHGYNTRSRRPETDYTGGMSEEEQMRQAMRDSINEAVSRRQPSAPPQPPPPGGYPSSYQSSPLPPPSAPTPTAPPQPPAYESAGLYPDLSQFTAGAHGAGVQGQGSRSTQGQSGVDSDELRRRRLNRFT